MTSSLARLLAAFLVAFALHPGAQAAGPKGTPYTLPDWFKPSLLDLREEVAEARKAGRQVMVFFHLEDCPWCARLLEESFEGGENRAFIEKRFDVVAIDVRGAQDTTWTDGARRSERGLAAHLKVRGTPTLLVLAPDGSVAARVNGYLEPQALRRALVAPRR